MSKAVKVTVAVAGIGLAAVAISGWLVIGRGFSAREEPTAVEAFIARRLRSVATPRSARDLKNPVAASDEVVSEAMSHFADHCASCHANDGGGNTPIGAGLYPKPPDMRQVETQNLSDGELYYIILNGIRFTGMPAFGKESAGQPDLDSWKLVHFIRRLPKLTEQELEAMKSMNPKSPHEMEEEEAIRRFLEGDDTPSSISGHEHD